VYTYGIEDESSYHNLGMILL